MLGEKINLSMEPSSSRMNVFVILRMPKPRGVLGWYNQLIHVLVVFLSMMEVGIRSKLRFHDFMVNGMPYVKRKLIAIVCLHPPLLYFLEIVLTERIKFSTGNK
jgi:hypothetical protein